MTRCYQLLSVTRYYLKLKCANCGEVPDRWQYITLSESQPTKEREKAFEDDDLKDFV